MSAVHPEIRRALAAEREADARRRTASRVRRPRWHASGFMPLLELRLALLRRRRSHPLGPRRHARSSAV